MPSIDERIAELEQRIAEKKAYERLYRPSRNVATWDYVAEGDRSGYDKIDASEAAYYNMLAQQKYNDEQRKAAQLFNAQQREIDRNLSRELAEKQKSEQAKYAQNEIANKYQLAVTDYELAQQQVDMQKPETLARLKRAAQLVNHYGAQLNFDAVNGEATEDAQPIKVNKAVSRVKALLKTKPNKWTDEQKQDYVDSMSLIPDEDERKADLEIAGLNMPITTDEKSRILKAANEQFKKDPNHKNPDTKKFKVIFVNNNPDHLEYK